MLAALSLELALQADAGGAWVHLLPVGAFSGRDGRGPYHVRDVQAVMMASRAKAGRRLIPIDYDHQIDHAEQNGQPAPAAGWIKGLQARADGIWGLVEWTAKAAAHLANREYRYLSPVIQHTGDGAVIRILRAALTNNPNLDQLTALASMETPMDNEAFLAELRNLVGLPDDADQAAIMAKLRDMLAAKQSAVIDPAQYVPIGDFERVVREVNRLNQGIEETAAQAYVDSQIKAANMPSYLKDWGVALCRMNKPAFDQFIFKTKGSFNRLVSPSGASAHPPGFTGATALNEEEKAVCQRMGLTEAEFAKG